MSYIRIMLGLTNECGEPHRGEIVLAFHAAVLLISSHSMYRLSGSPPRLVSASPPVLPGAFLFFGDQIPAEPKSVWVDLDIRRGRKLEAILQCGNCFYIPPTKVGRTPRV
jgi:hypothetical protein